MVECGRGTDGGNPFPVTPRQDAQRVVDGFACLLASTPDARTAREVGNAMGLEVAPRYLDVTAGSLQRFVGAMAQRVLAGEHVALRCPGCAAPLRRGRCHTLVAARAVEQRCSAALGEVDSDPADSDPTHPNTAHPTAPARAPIDLNSLSAPGTPPAVFRPYHGSSDDSDDEGPAHSPLDDLVTPPRHYGDD